MKTTTKLKALIKEAVQEELKEARFRSHEEIENWTGDAVDFLRELSLKTPGAAGRRLNEIAEKLEDAIAETWEHGYAYSEETGANTGEERGGYENYR